MRRSVSRSVYPFTKIHRLLALARSGKNIRRRRQQSSRIQKKKLRHNSSFSLIPGIPQEVVLDHILPRLPYYQRPVMRAVSKAWFSALRSPGDFTRRSKELLSNTGLVCCLLSGQGIELFDMSCSSWHDLPPIPGDMTDCFCIQGSVYVVISGSMRKPGRIQKLDLSGGLWIWEEVVPETLAIQCVTLAFEENGILYLAGSGVNAGFVAEAHRLRDADATAVAERMEMRGVCITRDNLKLLLFRDASEAAGAEILYVKPPRIRYSLPSYVSETEFYVVREGRYLEYHNMVRTGNEWVPLAEVDLRKKLGFFKADVVLAQACLADCIYIASVNSSAVCRVFEGVGAQRRELDKVRWREVRGIFSDGIALHALSCC